jgi:hypothetical protein
MTVLHKGASVCSCCHSMKGYTTNAYGIMGRKSVIGFGSVLLIFFTLVFLSASIACVPLATFCAWRVKQGPVWHHSKSLA